MMIYNSDDMENQAAMQTAARMCAAARTAPKTRGIDNIVTLVLTGEDKDALAEKMIQTGREVTGTDANSFHRDALNVKSAQAVVLLGVKKDHAGLIHCSFCGFENCDECEKAGARCAFNTIDLGIALGSAVSVAADDRVDNRIMFSIGTVARSMRYLDDDSILWEGIPISVSGKNVFFDRPSVKKLAPSNP